MTILFWHRCERRHSFQSSVCSRPPPLVRVSKFKQSICGEKELLTAVALLFQRGALFQCWRHAGGTVHQVLSVLLGFLQLGWCGLTAAGRPAAVAGGVRTPAVVEAAPVTATTGPGTWTQYSFFFWTTVALEPTAGHRNNTVTMWRIHSESSFTVY